MMRPERNQVTPSFGHFLEYLQLNKFPVSINHYARLELLFKSLSDDVLKDTESLKSYVRPIFAVSDVDQRRFSRLFDDYVQHCRRTVATRFGPKAEFTGDETNIGRLLRPVGLRHRFTRGWRKELRANRYYIAIILLAALVVFFLWMSNRSTTITSNPPLAGMSPGPSAEPQSTDVPTPAQTRSPTQESPKPPPTSSVVPPPLFYLAVFAALVFVSAIYALIRRWLPRLNPARFENKQPPFKWPLTDPVSPLKLFDSEPYRRAVRLLRKRQVEDFFRLDLTATLAATIRSLGYPSFQYKQATRVPEYLALIERTSPGDHQARFFDEVIRALKREGLIVTRYFYAPDSLLCCDETGDNCVRLDQLKQRHAGNRLLLFGSGENLLDPVTGRLAGWIDIFSNWHERAVITPQLNWGWRDRVLSTRFIVVQAGAEGLISLSNYFESHAEMDWLHESEPRAQLSGENNGPINLEKIRSYFGVPGFNWLAACAIYPELNWNLTLRLGKIATNGAINEENLLRLCSLRWFRTGVIPDSIRASLLQTLPPSLIEALRKEIVELMRHSVPPINTYAFNLHSLELTLHSWLLDKSRENLRKLRRAVGLIPSREIWHSTVLRYYLKAVPHRLFGFSLPRLLFRYRLPILGFAAGTQLAICLIVLAIAMSVLRARAKDVPQWAYVPFLHAASPSPVEPPEIAGASPNPSATPTATANASPIPSPSTTVNPSPEVTPSPDVIAGASPSPTSTASPSQPVGELYSGAIEDESSSNEDDVKQEIDPLLKRNPKAVIYLITGDVGAAEYVQQNLLEGRPTKIIDNGDTKTPAIKIVIKNGDEPPPSIQRAAGLPRILPANVRFIGDFDYLAHQDDAEGDAGSKIQKLIDELEKHPTAHGYIVANHISNGRLGENRFDAEWAMTMLRDLKNRVTLLFPSEDRDASDKDVSMYVAYDGAGPVMPGRQYASFDLRMTEADKSYLDGFAVELLNSPNDRGYIICHHPNPVERQKRCNQVVDYLVTAHSMDRGRLIPVTSDTSDKVGAELWLVPTSFRVVPQ